MSCLSKANLQITVGVGVPAFSGHPFKKSLYTKMPMCKVSHAEFRMAQTIGYKGRQGMRSAL